MFAKLLRQVSLKHGIILGLLLLIAGCFQPAGREIEPTSVDIAIVTPEPTATPTLVPTATTFITPLPPEGFIPPTDTPTPLPTQTPEPTPTAFRMFSETAAVQPAEPQSGMPTETPTEVPVLLPPTPTALPADKPCQHTVQPGEWLSKIARMYNLTNEDFLRANPWLRANPNNLKPGDVLVVPGCAPRVSGAVPPAQATIPTDPSLLPTPIQLTERIYTVVPGDTLGAIARKFGITVQQLRQANGLLEGDFIRVGQQLRIPAPQ
ncbi:MAG: LysM peptidoglycan-binding domain-containing protein [Anaerolineae bacterium]|nr:LysM peptidoglycan-binding domain-containing protein [Anaerolineae bacterium]MDW8298503.1 LysM peptidoglycan-binding domain-containing protein [Anaerolineae bacterium]